MRRIVLISLAVVLATASATPALAGGGGLGGSPCPGFSEGDEIVMLDSCFAGIAHFAGQAVTIVNDGQFPHTYTAVDGSFDSGMLQPGESYDLALDGPGVFEVFCTLHGTREGDGMAGVLVVGGGDLSAVAAPAVAAPPPAEPLAPELVAALDRQSAAIAELTAQEAALLSRLVSAGNEPAGWPPQLTAVLLVAAIALAGVFVVTRAPGRAGAEQQIGQPEGA